MSMFVFLFLFALQFASEHQSAPLSEMELYLYPGRWSPT